MDASLLRDMMHDAFSDQPKMANNYLLKPFSVLTSINYKKSFNAETDGYRYQINTLISQISLNFSPHMLRDILKF